MKYKIVLILTSVLLLLSTLNAEPSAFSAGNINNPNPYGLTQEEEQLLENRKNLNKVNTNLKKVTVKSNNQSNELDSIRDRIDGLQSIIENISRKEHVNKKKLRTLEDENIKRLQSADEYEKRLSEATQKNSQAIEEVKISLAALTLIVQKVSKDYVTKAEYNALVLDVNNFKDIVTKELSTTTKKTAFSGKTNGQIAKEAKEFYKSKNYTKAIKFYSYLIEHNYKPATSHYMIGEMNYKRKKYSDAIAYFKKSAKLYSKASYMPTLMLHTAISMKLNGDKKNAKAFLKATIKKYPGTKAAKKAKKELDLM